MRFWYDTEFIDDGNRIHLISIGIVAEDGREYYSQNLECDFSHANDWVWRNVYPHLDHFLIRGERACTEYSLGGMVQNGACAKDNCPWRYRHRIKEEVRAFCDPEKYGKVELVGYYSAYDHIAFCQLFGAMVDLPKGFPFYTFDIKQWCKMLGDPRLPVQDSAEHHALADARWVKVAYEFLEKQSRKRKRKEAEIYEQVG